MGAVARRLVARILRELPRRLQPAVLMLGVGVVSGLGQLLVDMPFGYFGTRESTTTAGLVFTLATIGLSIACALGALVKSRVTHVLFLITVLVGICLFIPALPTDPTVAGSIIMWQLGTLSWIAFVEDPFTRRRTRAIGSDYLPVVRHLLILSLFATTLVVGFQLTGLVTARVVCLGLDAIAIAVSFAVLHRSPWLLFWSIAAGISVVGALTLQQSLDAALAVCGVFQIGLLAVAIGDGPLIEDLMHQFVERPALLVIATFAAIALLGAVALTFPAAAAADPISPLDALFTSVSATCVTGLAVVDTPKAFSLFGEVVILALIQVGGLGIIVLSTFGTVLLGGRLTFRGEKALSHMLEINAPGQAYRLVRFIVLATLALEGAGAAALTIAYIRHGFGWSDALWRGTFHAISSFCNAGFSLHSDSIIIFQSDPFALGVHAALIVLGGLGFVVLAWLWSRVVENDRSRIPVQVRIVMLGSTLLVIGGAVVYAWLEWDASLAGMSALDKIDNALFQSVTTRTAGFNSVDLTKTRPATVLVCILLMFIGASPGGTGGGIKVTTFAVLTAAIPSIVATNSSGALLFGRSIPASTLLRAATITTVSGGVAFFALFLLLISENATFMVLAFEVASALGTVGLTLGVTPLLSSMGKVVILLTMYVGRIGPLTLALALGRRAPPIAYPEARIMVG